MHHRFDEKGHKTKLYSVLLDEGILMRLPKSHDRRKVDLVKSGKDRRSLLSLNEASRNPFANGTHRPMGGPSFRFNGSCKDRSRLGWGRRSGGGGGGLTCRQNARLCYATVLTGAFDVLRINTRFLQQFANCG